MFSERNQPFEKDSRKLERSKTIKRKNNEYQNLDNLDSSSDPSPSAPSLTSSTSQTLLTT